MAKSQSSKSLSLMPKKSKNCLNGWKIYWYLFMISKLAEMLSKWMHTKNTYQFQHNRESFSLISAKENEHSILSSKNNASRLTKSDGHRNKKLFWQVLIATLIRCISLRKSSLLSVNCWIWNDSTWWIMQIFIIIL